MTSSVGDAMTSETDILDAVVVGAGWAGLGVSHALLQRGLRHKVLERGRIGETWRTQRWDSFRLNIPNIQTVMPGDTYIGSDPDGAMTSGEFVALLEDYAGRHGLPVETGTPVTDLVASGGLYRLTIPRGLLWTRNVVIASSNQNCPTRPPLPALLPPDIHQIDASAYRNASALDSGAVLVVGSAQSGGQIAEDLILAGRTVFLATGRVGRLPRTYRGRHISVWMVLTGLIDVTRSEILEQGPIPGRPLQGALQTISCNPSVREALSCWVVSRASTTAASRSATRRKGMFAMRTRAPPGFDAWSTSTSRATGSTPLRPSRTRQR